MSARRCQELGELGLEAALLPRRELGVRSEQLLHGIGCAGCVDLGQLGGRVGFGEANLQHTIHGLLCRAVTRQGVTTLALHDRHPVLLAGPLHSKWPSGGPVPNPEGEQLLGETRGRFVRSSEDSEDGGFVEGRHELNLQKKSPANWPGDSKDYLDTGNYIENTANHYVMIIDEEGMPSPALITMKSTQLKKSRKWNSMMMSTKMMGKNGPYTPPMYSQLYRLTTQAESNDKGKWYGWEVERIGPVQDMSIYQAAKAFANSVASGDVKVKHQEKEYKYQEYPTTSAFTSKKQRREIIMAAKLESYEESMSYNPWNIDAQILGETIDYIKDKNLITDDEWNSLKKMHNSELITDKVMAFAIVQQKYKAYKNRFKSIR